MVHEETVKFHLKICKRWLKKADSYNENKINDLYDKFFTLFVAYNSLYKAINHHQGWNDGDKKSATKNVPKYLGYSNLTNHLLINIETKNAISKIVKLIDDRIFYINLELDKEYIEKIRERIDISFHLLNDELDKNFVESLLGLIYQTRCNMFHGDKQINNVQKELLIPIHNIITSIIRMGIAKLES